MSVAALVVVAFAVGGAALLRPAWYHPGGVDFGKLAEDKRAFVRLLDDIGTALNRGQPITLTLEDAQVNRWLAARNELPELSELEGLRRAPADLLVRFSKAGAIQIAGMTRWGGLSAVISMQAQPRTTSRDLDLIKVNTAVGNVPIPLARLGRWLRLNGAGGRPTLIGDTLRWENRLVWPNGRRLFRVGAVEVEDGRLRVTLEPVP